MSTSDVCFFFAYNGNCTSGDECTFAHVVEDAPPSSVSGLNSDHTGSENTYTTYSPQSDELNAKQKNSYKPFKRGNSCKFLHGYGQSDKSSSGQRSRESSTSFSDYRRTSISSERSGSVVSSAPPEQLVISDESEIRDEDDSRDKKESDNDIKNDAPPNEAHNTIINNEPQSDQPESEIEKEENLENRILDYEQALIAEQESESEEDSAFPDHERDKSLDTITPGNNYVPADDQDSPSTDPGNQETQPNIVEKPNPQFAIDSHVDEASEAQGANIDVSGDGQGLLVDNQAFEDQSNIRIPHWTEYADPQANPFVSFCKFFARGRCNHGASCTYRHALTVQEYFLLFRLEPLTWSSYVQTVQTVQTPHEDNQALVPSSSLGPCIFYPLGKCRNGDKCPYAHIEPPDSGPESDEQDKNGWEGNNDDNHEQKVWDDGKQQPCKYFLRDGSCRRGDVCYYSHEKKDDNSWVNVPTNDPASDRDQGQSSWDQGQFDWNQGQWGGPHSTDAKDSAAAWGVNADNQDEKAKSNDNAEASERVNSDQISTQENNTRETKSNDDRDDSEWGNVKGSSQSSSHQNDSRRRVVCRHYLRGFCPYANCKFTHEVDESANANSIDNSTNNSWSRNNRIEDNLSGGDWASQWISSSKRDPKDEKSSEFQKKKFDAWPGDSAQEQDGANRNNSSKQADVSDTSDGHHTEAWLDHGRRNQSSESNADSRNHRAGNTTASTTSKRYCRFFARGRCLRGNSCTNLHVQPDDPIDGEDDKNAENQGNENHAMPVLYDENIVAERPMYNCMVSFGDGGRVQHALTMSDPNRIILKNLPSKDVLHELESISIEGLRNIYINAQAEAESATLEFDTQLQTLRALRVLEDYGLPDSTLSVQSQEERMEVPEGAELSCEVRVTWPAPCRIAWARYSSVAHAKEEAARLDGQIFEGRKVEAKYWRPQKGQISMFAVQISNLPPEITDILVKQRCQGCQFINLTKPTYVSSPIEQIKGLLSQHGLLVTFDAPNLPLSAETMIAFAKFDTTEAATAAAEAMRDFEADFLGDKGFLKVERVYRSRFDVQPEQFRYIEGDLEKLRGTYRRECSILVVRTDKSATIYAHAPIENEPMFAKLLISLGSLVYGDVLKQDGTIVWDDYLNMTSSTKVIDAINVENSKDYNVLVVPDHRAQRILILGEQTNRPRAKESILKILKKVRTAWNEVPFDRIFVRWYLEQGQSQIQSDSDIGQNKVSLDLSVPKLIVRGDSKVLNKVKECMANAVAIRRESLDQAPADICHICLYRPISPIILRCQHQYCEKCIKTLFASSVEDIRIPLKCLAKSGDDLQCVQDFPYVAIRDLLPMADEDRLFRTYFLAYVRSNMEGLFFCPSPQCNTIHRHNEGKIFLCCPSCDIDICSSCQTKYHQGMTCDQRKKIAFT